MVTTGAGVGTGVTKLGVKGPGVPGRIDGTGVVDVNPVGAKHMSKVSGECRREGTPVWRCDTLCQMGEGIGSYELVTTTGNALGTATGTALGTATGTVLGPAIGTAAAADAPPFWARYLSSNSSRVLSRQILTRRVQFLGKIEASCSAIGSVTFRRQ